MFLTASPSFEFVRFMQILVWIILPVLLSAVTLTIFFHYRRKKKANITADDAETDLLLASPEQFNHRISDGEYVFFDHSSLIREYKNKMFYNHARYAALRNDYAVLEAKYSSLANSDNIISLLTTKKIDMKNHDGQTADSFTADQATEKKELADKLEQLHRSYQRLEEENRFLQEQVSLQTADDTERDRILNRWKEEHAQLRDKVTEYDYLEELLDEKKAQISFLQVQLEQRIKSQHQADQQRQQAIAEMEEHRNTVQNFRQQVAELQNELQLKQDHTEKLQMSFSEKEDALTGQQQVLLSKMDRITYLENVLNETREQNELLNAELADRKDEVANLQQLLTDERSRLEFMDQKLAANKQLLRRLHKELSVCMDDNEKLPFIVISDNIRSVHASNGL